MYKALIVDDEKMIREGMRQVIPWTALGIQEVYTAASAMEALDIIHNQNPQLMVTDISMTEMTGLDLIGIIRKENENMRIIVLTGYERFDYARECLRMNVNEFLLKPIDETVLSDCIRLQIEEFQKLDRSREENSGKNRAENLVRQARLESFMRDAVHRRIGEKADYESLIREFHLQKDVRLQIGILVPELYAGKEDNEDNFKILSLENICIGMVDARGCGITFLDDDYKIIIVFFVTETGSSVTEKAEELIDILEDELNIRPRMVIGSEAEGMESLFRSYHDAVFLLEHEQDSIREIVKTHSEAKREGMFQEIFGELKYTMAASVADVDYLFHVFDTFKKAVHSYNLSHAFARRCCFELVSAVCFAYASETGEGIEGKLNALMQSLMNAKKEDACELSEMFLRQMLAREEEDISQIVAKAKRYIDEKLGEELSVADIASVMYVSPNYFSRLFKRVTGEGCNEYIVRKRIEKAKSLLETTTMKTGRIAMLVGYRDTNYFSMAFKKHMGVSPTKYREEINKSNRIL